MISVRGRSGSGKTTLITRIVENMAIKGFQIVVIKHSSKTNPAIDPEGKDTAKHLQAGASLVVGSFKETTFFFLKNPMTLERILRVCSNLGDWDLCLIEGYYHEAIPNIVLESKDSNTLTIANSAEQPLEIIVEKLHQIIAQDRL